MIAPPRIQVSQTAIDGLLVLEPQVFRDERGWFSESFNAQDFSEVIGSKVEFAQDNHSFSRQWTLRGMHYQIKQSQGRLLRVVAGRIFDVAVDLRINSRTFGRWSGIELSSSNHKQIWIPAGFAHGFLVLSETADVLYKSTDYYHPQSEVCLAWNDSQVNIEWPLPQGIVPNISAKDSAALSWDAAPKF